jgi:hypothetical protein
MYFYCYVYVFLLYDYVPSSCQLALLGYTDRGFSVFFPQLSGKFQGITSKDGARPALFQNLCVVLRLIIIIMALQLFMQSFGLLNQFLPPSSILDKGLPVGYF